MEHLNINSRPNKFDSIPELIKGKFQIFLINETELEQSCPSNQFAMYDYKFIIKDGKKLWAGTFFILMISYQAVP